MYVIGVPRRYWTLTASAVLDGAARPLTWERARCFDRAVTAALAAAASMGGVGTVVEANERGTTKAPPPPFNTVELLKAASRVLRLSPAQTMKHAEHLYLDGFLSYPRTETTRIPDSMDVREILEMQSGDDRWGPYVRTLLEGGTWRKPKRGVDAGDHPPVTPTSPAPQGVLHGPAARLYDLVARRFLAAVSPDAAYRTQEVVLEEAASRERFHFDRTVLIDAGFLEVLRPDTMATAAEADSLLAALPRAGGAIALRCDPVPKEATTRPPDRLTEADCVALMERNGIGTDASISSHIENICKRSYVVVEKSSRRLRPTALGVAVCRGFLRVDAALVLPEVRATIERMCDHVADGDAPREAVVEHAIANFAAKYAYVVEHVAEIEELFDAIYCEKPEDDARRPPFSRCGLTRQYLQLVPRPHRLYNPFTKDVVNLPQGGGVVASGGQLCPVCKSELLWYMLRDGAGDAAKATGYPLCGRCFDVHADPDRAALGLGRAAADGDDESDGEAASRGGAALDALRVKAKTWGPAPPPKQAVLECPMPDDHPALDNFLCIVDATLLFGDDARGAVVLEPNPPAGRPPRLVSTRRPVFLGKFHSSVAGCRVVQNVAGDRLLELAFVPGQSPLDRGEVVCARRPTDALVRSLLSVRRADLAPPLPKQSGKGRGKGRGGRRDGRGKGRRDR